MNPGSLLMSGMKSSCTRRAASLEFVTPSYRRTVKYALLLMVMILHVTCVFMYSFQNPSGKGTLCTPVSYESGFARRRLAARLCFQLLLMSQITTPRH